jgi:hypothetical protein
VLAAAVAFGSMSPMTGIFCQSLSAYAATDQKPSWSPKKYYTEGDFTFQYVQAGYVQIIEMTNDTAEEVVIPETITDAETGLSFPVKTIYASAFNGKSNMKKVTIPDTVTKIGPNAFSNCEGLEEIVGMQGVKYINDDAFLCCTSLKELHLPDTLTNIGNEAFDHCDSLTELTIPGSVTYMGSNIASACQNLKTITFAEGLKNVGNYFAYLCPALESISLPSTLKSIGMGAFSYSGLMSVELPDNITRVDNDTFANCKRLTRAKLSSGMSIINMITNTSNVSHVGIL